MSLPDDRVMAACSRWVCAQLMPPPAAETLSRTDCERRFHYTQPVLRISRLRSWRGGMLSGLGLQAVAKIVTLELGEQQ
jgi:hypothetical protein